MMFVSFLVFLFALTQAYAGPARPGCAGTTPANPLPEKDANRLKSRFKDVFTTLEAFHKQWKDISDKTREAKCKGQAGPDGNIEGRTVTPSLSADQLTWFNSLGVKNETGTGGKTKRGFRFRREYRQLACWERQNFHKALRRMKTTMIGM